MDQVFAPWRIDWVERTDHDSGGCPFCELPADTEDRANRIVARSEHAYVLLNNYPYNPGHAMVIPGTHGGEFGALEEPVVTELATLTQRTIDALEAAFEPDGFNTGMNLGGSASGGSIDDHVHRHVVPRWGGDTNFMPVISETAVIVEALEESYERLHDAFATQSATTVESPDDAVTVGLE